MIGEHDPVCDDLAPRRADVRAHPDPLVNGIDFLEVDPDDHSVLRVHFLKPVPPEDAGDPGDVDDAYGLRANPGAIRITGGRRVVGIEVDEVSREPDGSLTIRLDRRGDFSRYVLEIDLDHLDPYLRRTGIDFSAPCPVELDCRRPAVCPPDEPEEPLLDYQAKDYASFRRLLLDLLPELNPGFTERNPSDLGVALIELLAYVGDHLSYYQDAVSNEAFLDTVRQRISARRHARLIDYRMHDGRNAWTWVHVRANAPGVLDRGTPVLTRVFEALRGEPAPPSAVIDSARVGADALETDPALAATVVYETAHDAAVDPVNNEIFVHTWANEGCCLAPGTRELFLYSVNQATGQASRPLLAESDDLLLEEVLGPATGHPADADPDHRQVLRIEGDPDETDDPLYRDTLAADAEGRRVLLQPNGGGDPPLPLLRVRFRRRDALAFPACLSVLSAEGDLIRHVTVARGNLVLADHGVTTEDLFELADLPGGVPVRAGSGFRLDLRRGPLTQQRQPEEVTYGGVSGRLTVDRPDLEGDAAGARPAVALLTRSPAAPDPELWTPVPDLLDSPPAAQHFVAEVANDGRAVLRFGDGQYGAEPTDVTELRAVYRFGNGREGNVGAGSLRHVAVPGGVAPFVDSVRNPLPGSGGVDPETIEEVRRFAPQAFWAEQLRAVTEDDYRVLAERLPEVASAVASFRWTGSWLTVFVGIDPTDPADLVQEGQGLSRLSDRLAALVRAELSRLRIAGYDLEIRPPRFVPLEIDLDLCVCREHFRSEVARVVAEKLSNRVLPDRRRGFFHPDHFSFGDPVYLSRLYAAVEEVEGVDSVVVRRFRRWGERDRGELARGVLEVGPWEVPRLDNDASFMENGVLRITALGGKG